MPTMLALLEENGVMDNFRRLTGKKNVPRRGPLYTDSDIYKWMEAAAWALHNHDNPQLQADIDRLTAEIGAAQEPSGYLNTYWVEDRAKDRFQKMQSGHELYCLGHLLQAGIAYYRATGKRNLLDIGVRFVDYLERDFGPGKRPLLTGHPELELALAELYRTTGERKYLDQAKYFCHIRGRPETHKLRGAYQQDDKPIVEQTEALGHSVRAGYFYSGVADVAAALAVDRSGNVIVAGDVQGATPHRYFSCKYANNGTPLWTNVMAAPGYQGGDGESEGDHE